MIQPPRLDDLQTSFSSLAPSVWAQNLYWNWLYSLAPLLETKEAGYPPFMLTRAWQDKSLAAALGSWAELRHDTVLYGEQGYPCGISDAQMDQGWVEPDPEAFARLRALAIYARDGLTTLGLFHEIPPTSWGNPTSYPTRVNELIQTLGQLQAIAEKELAHQPISYEEYLFIRDTGHYLGNLTSFHFNGSGYIPYYSGYLWDEMAIIADVHTSMGRNECLQVGVGRPLQLFVIVDVAGDLRVTQGAAFSYYEFTQPLNSRLTDTGWQELLRSDTPPSMPQWMSSYCDLDAGENHIDYGSFHEFPAKEMNVVLSPEIIRSGKSLHVQIKDVWYYEYNYDYDPINNDSYYIYADGARVLITNPQGQTTPFSLEISYGYDPQDPDYRRYPTFNGWIGTVGWEPGLYYVQGELLVQNEPVLSYRTFFNLLEHRNDADPHWSLYP